MPTKPPTWEDTVEDTPPKWEDTEDIAPAAEPPGYVPETPAAPLRFDPAYMGVPMGEWEKPMLEVPASIPKALIKGSMALPTPNVTQLLRLLPPAKREEAIQGIAESAASGASSLTSPGGIGVAAGLAAAPQVVLPAMMVQGASQVPAGVQAVRQAEGAGPTAKAGADLAQTLAMVAGPVVPPVARRMQALRRPPVIPVEQPPIIPPAEPPIIPPEVKPVEPVAEPAVPAVEKVTSGLWEGMWDVKEPGKEPRHFSTQEDALRYVDERKLEAAPPTAPETGITQPKQVESGTWQGMWEVRREGEPHRFHTKEEAQAYYNEYQPAAPASETTKAQFGDPLNPSNKFTAQPAKLEPDGGIFYAREHRMGELENRPGQSGFLVVDRDAVDEMAFEHDTYQFTPEDVKKTGMKFVSIPELDAAKGDFYDAIQNQKKGAPDATKEGQVQESVLGERERTEAQRIPAETGVSDSLQPAAPVAETPPETLPNAPAREPVLGEPPPKESLTVEPKAREPLKIGDEQRVMGVDSVLADTKTIGGVRYEIFSGQKLKENRAAIRVSDEGTGNTVHIKQFPTYQAAQKEFSKTVSLAQKTTQPPSKTAAVEAPRRKNYIEMQREREEALQKRAEEVAKEEADLQAKMESDAKPVVDALKEVSGKKHPQSGIATDRGGNIWDEVVDQKFTQEQLNAARRWLIQNGHTDTRLLRAIEGARPKPIEQPPSKTEVGKGEVTDVLASLNEDNPLGAVDALRSMKFADAKELLFRRLGIVDPRLDTSSKKNLIASFEKVAPEYTKSARQEKAKASRIRTLEREIQERTENLARHDQVVAEGGPDYAGLEVGVTREQAAQKIKDLQAELDKLRPTPPLAAETGEKGPGMEGSVGAAAASSTVRTGTAPPEFYEGTSLKNATAEVERAAYGLPDATPTQKRAMAEQWIESGKVAEADPFAAQKLIDSLKWNPDRGLTDLESAIVLREKMRVENAMNDAAERTFKETDPARKAAAQGEWDSLSNRLLEIMDAAKHRGSEWGREGRWRQAVAYTDFSFASLERQMRMNRGGAPLTDAERVQLKAMADKWKATAESLQKDLATSQARVSLLEAQREIDKAIKETPPPYDKRILDYAERFVVRMEDAAKPAAARLRERLSRMSVGVDPTIIADAAIVGSAKLARIGLNKARWIDSMVADFSEKIRPMLDDIWAASNRLLEDNLKPIPEKVKTTVRKIMSVGERKAAIEAQIEEKILKGKLNDLQPVLRKYERVLAEQGIRNRDVMIDTIHAFASKLDPRFTRDMTMDAISGYGDFRPLTKDEIDVVLRDLHQQYQQLGKLRDMAAGQAPKRTGFQRQAPSDEGRRLIQQVEEAKRRGGYTVTDPEAQLRSALDAAKKRLTDQIADLDHQIQTRQKIVKNRTKLQYDDEYNKLKAIRDEKKALFDEVFPKAPITEAQRLEAWNRHIDRRMAELQERIKNKDFSKKVRRPPPTLGPKELEKQDIMARLQEQFHELLLRDKYKNMHGAQKAYMLAKEAMNIPRNVMTSADVSAVLRQGGILSASHPVIAARALVPMFKGMASERMAGIIDQEILSRPNAKSGRYAQAKLYLAPLRSTTLSAMEEQVMSRFAHRIPLVRASNRAFITFLNRLRADSFDAFTEALETKGSPLNESELKAIANYINITTGRGDLGARYNAGAELAATVLFSPRLVTSRFQFLAGQPLYRGSARTRALVAQEYGRSLTALAVFLGLGYLAGGTVELDPRSSDFGKLRFGNTRLDPMAGLSQSAVFLSRTGAAAANVLAETLAKRKLLAGETKTVKGKVRMLGGPEVGYGQKDFADVVLTFLRSKFAPVPGSLIDILSRKNMVGEKVTPGDVIGRFEPLSETALGRATGIESEIPVPVPGTFTMPLSMQDAFNVMKEHGVARGIALEVLSLFGMGLQYFDPSQTRRK